MVPWFRFHFLCASVVLASIGLTTVTEARYGAVYEIMEIHHLLVTEGGHSVITSVNIKDSIGHEEFGATDSLVLFKIVKPALHGKLIVSGEHTFQSPVNEFTSTDLIGNKIVYVHDSSEDLLDSVDMEVQHIVHLSGLNVTKKLYYITLAIQVFPRNDAPELMLRNCTIQVIAYTRLRMTGMLLNASDADNKPDDLLYYVHYQNGFDGGYFEVHDSIKVKSKVMYFTQFDVNSGKVYYVNRGRSFQQVSLQVSDGKDVSNSQTLNIEAVELKVRNVINQTLVLPYYSSGLITTDNLQFSTNAQFQDIELRFEITRFARWGIIQRQRYADNIWADAFTFTQQSLYEHRLRYLHNTTSSTVTGDSFHYQITALGSKVEDAEFCIKFSEINVVLVKNSGLHLQGLNEGALTTDVLQAKCSIPMYNNPDHIFYLITALPNKGHLISKSLAENKLHYDRKMLYLGQNFSQADINSQVITYKMTKTPHGPDTDGFEFEIVASGFRLKASLFQFSFQPLENGLHTVNSGLTDVVEGQGKQITPLELFAEGPFHAFTTFFVTDGPYHGALQMLHRVTGLNELHTSNSFNTDDILSHRVHYYHDDSENDTDSFSFKSVSTFNSSESYLQNITELYGIFDIRIAMTNDNPPQKGRSVMFCDRSSTGSIIKPSDLRFVDPDVNSEGSLLQYDWFKNNSLEVVLSSNHEIKVNRFTQKDIESGKLYLKHHCSGHGTFSSTFTVTDGHFIVKDLFQIKLLDPFVHLEDMTHLLLRETERIIMYPHYFRIETNAETSDSNILISIINETSCGVFKKINDISMWFTLEDLKNLLISYDPDSTNISCNDIKFVVTVNGLNSQGWIRIEFVTDDSRFNFMKAYNNRARVEEFNVLTLTSQFLHFKNLLANTSEVYYTVTSPPSNGKLWLIGKQNTELYVFTQTDIDNGNLHYEHQLNGQNTDVFQFDIQCNSFFVTGQQFFIDVIPLKIPLTVQNLTVREGSVTFVTQHSLSIESRFFHDDDIEFQIVAWPQHGNVQNKDMSETRISQFSAGQVLKLKILYANDGSDVTSDAFDIYARSRLHNKRSDVKTVHIRILPINDRPPILVINKKLKVFAETSMSITRDHLYAIDNDTQPDNIVFHLTEVVNITVGKTDNPFENVWNFTQADIDSNKVIVHMDEGKETASFKFRVSDDVNISELTSFEIESILLILTLESCQTLTLFPSQIQPITTLHLKSKTNYTYLPDRSVLYKIIRRPVKGKLVLFSSDGQHKDINEFTQEDLDMNIILYSHSSQMDGWTQNDSFVFQVHSNFTKNLSLETFTISISYDNIDLNDSMWNFTCQPAVVSEGGKVVITRSELDASFIEYRLPNYGLEDVVVSLIVQEIPSHGFMTLGVVNMTRGSKITQKDIDQGLLIYTHDDSESYFDKFSFIVEIVAKVKTSISKPEVHQLPHLLRVLPFAIEPINDQHFVLLTPVPAIELVQGSKYLITDEVLLTVDPDTPSENITYEIESPPTNGFLVCLNEFQLEPVMSFTQQDINEKRIKFVHDGSSDSGAFYFKVSDGKHRPLYKVFNILIMPLIVDIMLKPIEILQGQNQTILSQHHFNVKTNGRKEMLMYNITRPPMYGSLFMNNTVTYHFSQLEVETGQVHFFQDDLSTLADEFEFLLYDIKNIIHGKMDITVLPNIKKIDNRPFSAVTNNVSEISLDHLDASELAKLTSSDPVYHVTDGPMHGVLIRNSPVEMEDWPNTGRVQTSNGEKLKLGQSYVDSFFQFTHSDIANGRIKYMPNHNITSVELKDGFAYIVTASSVQPAKGTFLIKVFQTEALMQRDLKAFTDKQNISADVFTIFPKTNLVSLAASEVAEMNSFEKSMIIIFSLLAVLIMAIIVIIVIRCVKRNRQMKTHTKEASIVSLVSSAAFSLAVPSFIKDNQESQHNLPTIQEEPLCATTEQKKEFDYPIPVTDLRENQASTQSPTAVFSPTNNCAKDLDEKLLLYFERLTAV